MLQAEAKNKLKVYYLMVSFKLLLTCFILNIKKLLSKQFGDLVTYLEIVLSIEIS